MIYPSNGKEFYNNDWRLSIMDSLQPLFHPDRGSIADILNGMKKNTKHLLESFKYKNYSDK